MKISLKTNNPSVVGSKHDFKKQMKSKQLISKIVNKYISQYDLQTLQEVMVYKLKEGESTLGSVTKRFVNDEPTSIVNLSDLVAGQLHFPQFYRFAYHRVHHEMCHVQDYEIICKHMDGNLLSDDYPHTYGLNSLYFVNGYKFFGEYISYRNCFDSYSEQHPRYDLLTQEAQIEMVIQRLRETYDKESGIRLLMFNKTIEDISKPIYDLCRIIGYFHASNDESFLKNFDLIKSNAISDYINNLAEELDTLYLSYPNWISYKKYIEIGKLFFSIFDKFEIALSEYNGDICFDERKPSLDEQIAIAQSKVKPSKEPKKPNPQPREIGER